MLRAFASLCTAALVVLSPGIARGADDGSVGDRLTQTLAVLDVIPSSLTIPPSTDVVTLEIRNEGSGTLVWSISSPTPWLSLSRTSGTGNRPVEVTVDRSGLPVGFHPGAIYVTSNGGDATISVSLEIAPHLVVEPVTPLYLPAHVDTQFVTISNPGGGELEWTIDEDDPWLSFEPESGVDDTVVRIVADRTHLDYGDHHARWWVTSNGGDLGPFYVEVAVKRATMTVEPGVIDMGAEQERATFEIRNSGSDPLDWTLTEDVMWLTATPTSGENDATITVDVDRTRLPGGHHTAVIAVESAGGDRNVMIEVESVQPVTVNPGTLDFGYFSDLEAIFVDTVEDDAPWTIAGDVSWISADPAIGVGDRRVVIRVDRASLSTGVHDEVIEVVSGGRQIAVPVRVSAGPKLAVGPSVLIFTDFDTLKTVRIMNQGEPGLEWTAVADSSWVSVDPVSGTGDGEVTVDLDYEPATKGLSTPLRITSNGGDRDIATYVTDPVAGDPKLYLYFDGALTQRAADCPGVILDTLYVVARGFETWVNGLEFRIEFPDEVAWLVDQPMSTFVTGTTRDGISMVWSIPQILREPRVVVKVIVLWLCTGCAEADIPIPFGPHPETGAIRAVEVPTQRWIAVTGMSAYICPTVETRPMTWSRIKALMRGEPTRKENQR